MSPTDPANHIDLFLFFFGLAALLITQITGIISPKWRHYHVFAGGAFILFGLAFEVGLKGPAIIFGATHVAI